MLTPIMGKLEPWGWCIMLLDFFSLGYVFFVYIISSPRLTTVPSSSGTRSFLMEGVCRLSGLLLVHYLILSSCIPGCLPPP